MTNINVGDYVTFASYRNDNVERTVRVERVMTDHIRAYKPRTAEYRTYLREHMGRILNITPGDQMTPAEYAMLIPK